MYLRPPTRRPLPHGLHPDVVVIGAGGAGAVLAARLSADPDRTVLLVEAGEVPTADYPEELLDARLVPGAQPGQAAVHGYPAMLTRELPYAATRGRIAGGSTTVNGGYFIRARTSDFARWSAAAQDCRWSYEQVLPLLRGMETDLDLAAGDLHGGTGPMPIRRTSLDHPAARAFQRAALDLGYPAEPDKNAQDAPGFGPVPSNAVDGIRVNTGLAYLRSALPRPNLHVAAASVAQKIVIRGGRATAVVLEQDRRWLTIETEEIVVCAGAFGSAHLLHLSGIGDASALGTAGIRVVADLPAVGAAFSDHPQLVVNWDPLPGLPAATGSWLGGALHLTSPGGQQGDVEILQSLVPIAGLFAGLVEVPGAPLAFLVSTRATRGSGQLATVSSDPMVPPKITYGYLETADDRERMRFAVRAAAEVIRTAAFGEISKGLAEPGPAALADDAALDRWIAARLGTAQHTCGTVPMGRSDDAASAVDGQGRVHGIAGLRVADTSILPDVPLRGPANTAVLIGEVIAEAIMSR